MDFKTRGAKHKSMTETKDATGAEQTKKPRRAEAKVIGQKTVRGYIAEINRLLRLPDTTLEQKIELLRQSERYQKLLVRRTPRKAKTPENASPWAS